MIHSDNRYRSQRGKHPGGIDGHAGNTPIREADSPHSQRFGEALKALMNDLARQIVLDGERATKFIEIWVTGAPEVASARTVAFAIANSPLVKTAFFGEDANRGKIVAAAGRAGVPIDPRKVKLPVLPHGASWRRRVTLFFEDVSVFQNGTPTSILNPFLQIIPAQIV